MSNFLQTVKLFRPNPNLFYGWASWSYIKFCTGRSTGLHLRCPENSRQGIGFFCFLFVPDFADLWQWKIEDMRNHLVQSDPQIKKTGRAYFFSRCAPDFGNGRRSFPTYWSECGTVRERRNIPFSETDILDMWKVRKKKHYKVKKLLKRILKQYVTTICVLQFPHIGGMENCDVLHNLV